METSVVPDSNFVERRRHDRLKSYFDVDVILFSGSHVGDHISGKVINVSKEGLGVVLRSHVPPGTRLELTIFSEMTESAGSGEVIWREKVKGRTVHGIIISNWAHLDPSIEQSLSHPL